MKQRKNEKTKESALKRKPADNQSNRVSAEKNGGTVLLNETKGDI
jgi:hypothetical protein